MWRYFVAGLTTVTGLAVLFISALGGPTALVRDRNSAVAAVSPEQEGTQPAPAVPPAAATTRNIITSSVVAASIDPPPVEPVTVSVPVVVEPPVYRGPVAQSLPWEPNQAPVPRVRTRAPSPRPAGFVAVLRRDFRSLFRTF